MLRNIENHNHNWCETQRGPVLSVDLFSSKIITAKFSALVFCSSINKVSFHWKMRVFKFWVNIWLFSFFQHYPSSILCNIASHHYDDCFCLFVCLFFCFCMFCYVLFCFFFLHIKRLKEKKTERFNLTIRNLNNLYSQDAGYVRRRV